MLHCVFYQRTNIYYDVRRQTRAQRDHFLAHLGMHLFQVLHILKEVRVNEVKKKVEEYENKGELIYDAGMQNTDVMMP